MGSITLPKTQTILLVDDEPGIVEILEKSLPREDLNIIGFTDPEEAYEWGKAHPFDLLVTDLKMQKMTGLELHEKLQGYYPDLLTILITGHQSLDSAQEAIRSNVYAYVNKPFHLEEIKGFVRRALEKKDLLDRNHQLLDEQQVLIEKLLVANKALKKLDRLKNEFVSNISHELRTPLTSMVNIVYNLTNGILGPLTEKQREYIEMLDEDTGRLVALINDILDLSQLESGAMRLTQGAFCLRESVEAVLKVIEGHKSARGLRFIREFQDGVEAGWTYADRAKIEQVLVNLISNAVKYIGSGKRVWIRVSRKTDRLLVSVTDEGIGISEEDQARIFNRFVQLEKMARGGTKGTGLGLAIVKKILELHGEEIRIKSAPGQGSTFSFELPMHESKK